MIIGAHTILFSTNAEADRAFIGDVLKFSSVDGGGGWLILAAPPTDIAVHPSDENDRHEFYLMTDDLGSEMTRLAAAGVACDPVIEERWGSLTRIALPGGGRLGLYQPKHPLAFKR